MTIEDIAKVCHEANRAFCESIGDSSQPTWEEAPEWQRKSAVSGVRFNIQNPFLPASYNHESWLFDKAREGWKYGPVKDSEKKEHPCFVEFSELPEEQKAKDYLFKAVVGALSSLVS